MTLTILELTQDGAQYPDESEVRPIKVTSKTYLISDRAHSKVVMTLNRVMSEVRLIRWIVHSTEDGDVSRNVCSLSTIVLSLR